jgi:hypothetical protein
VLRSQEVRQRDPSPVLDAVSSAAGALSANIRDQGSVTADAVYWMHGFASDNQLRIQVKGWDICQSGHWD